MILTQDDQSLTACRNADSRALFLSAHVLYFLIHEKKFVRFSFVISKNESSQQLNMHCTADKSAYWDLYSAKHAYHTWFVYIRVSFSVREMTKNAVKMDLEAESRTGFPAGCFNTIA